MSLLRLLFFCLVFATFGIAYAEDQPRQTENVSPKIIKPFSGITTASLVPPTRSGFSSAQPNWRLSIANPDLDATCYTMRTYVADRNFDRQFVLKPGVEGVSYAAPARNGSQPDSNLPATYTTCQPSSRFEVKTTVQSVENGSESK